MLSGCAALGLQADHRWPVFYSHSLFILLQLLYSRRRLMSLDFTWAPMSDDTSTLILVPAWPEASGLSRGLGSYHILITKSPDI